MRTTTQVHSCSEKVTTDRGTNSFVESTPQLQLGSPGSTEMADPLKDFNSIAPEDLLQPAVRALRYIVLMSKSQDLNRVIKLSLFSLALALQIPSVNAKGTAGKIGSSFACLSQRRVTKACRITSYVSLGVVCVALLVGLMFCVRRFWRRARDYISDNFSVFPLDSRVKLSPLIYASKDVLYAQYSI
ncbi:hypothetical protein D9619_011637 [Psilocybe cf. subviscida]|uniref:Uncharacterized protein n=1 Tax=Psilocybe cf. subviscida TaxID=2480587 RepID=A0A8H5F9N8_9AGAR|nr:hypothetical protein D9619_011637 [Psilocybe cf. subviscida]